MDKYHQEIVIDHLKNEVKSLMIGEMHKINENNVEFIVDGKLFIEIKFEDEIINKEVPLNIKFSKINYPYKNFDIKIEDYQYVNINNQLIINLVYAIIGEDISFDRFCFLDEDKIDNQLKDILNLDLTRSLNIDEKQIKIIEENLEPLIIENKEIEEIDLRKEKEINETNEEITENKEEIIENNEVIIEIKEEKIEEIKEDIPTLQEDEIIKEEYISTYIYYRLKENETLEDVAKRFNISLALLKDLNKKELKANSLIYIPYV